ncbi:TetR/AcrR family transcriptional regulator [Camelliibacillus cellulosilyticus]|uniref:TetR/AcrR family transcriptional regulator n=1 Tax=Camelliibacillus cellulosilyticus TaxID=2174486 RepID=A0ABV9GK23_9BACL
MAANDKKVDPRVKRTRQMLRDALIELILEKNYKDITVRDITDRATLNRATFYLHYRDKDELMKQSADEVLEELTSSLESHIDETYDFNYRGVDPHPTFIHLFEQIAKNASFYHALLKEKIVPHFIERMMQILENFISKGMLLVEPDNQRLALPREIVENYLVSAFLGVIVWWLEAGRPYSPTYMAGALMRMANKGPYVD